MCEWGGGKGRWGGKGGQHEETKLIEGYTGNGAFNLLVVGCLS